FRIARGRISMPRSSMRPWNGSPAGSAASVASLTSGAAGVLRLRVLTALVLAPLTLAAIVLASPRSFAFIIGAVILLLALEFGALCSLGRMQRAVFAALATALYASAIVPWQFASAAGEILVVFAVAAWLLAPAWLATRKALPAALKALLGLPVLAGAGFALHALK